MKPAWDQLIDEYVGHATTLVGAVDCTEKQNKALCDTHQVKGYPALKYGNPDDLHDYEGKRDFDSLKAFAEKNLKPTCSPHRVQFCDEEKQKEIETYKHMRGGDLDKHIKEKEDELAVIKKDFNDKMAEMLEGYAALEEIPAGPEKDKKSLELAEQYDQLSETRDKQVRDVKDSGLIMMKAVKAWKAKQRDEL